ncbi:hypothetical protein TSH7_25375 [Azospirillum sp. TSH7]|nr:hypothetical protein TSH7_25375 [Azospirillum sp. TSH7]PWC64434.1 hypothetical protein TSH20_18335 [Azospirillum sp. TSH20]
MMHVEQLSDFSVIVSCLSKATSKAPKARVAFSSGGGSPILQGGFIGTLPAFFTLVVGVLDCLSVNQPL